MTVTIRPLTPQDRTAWEGLFSAYAAFYNTTLPDGAFDTVWHWIFDPENDFWCDLAVSDEGIAVGFTQYQLMHRSLGASMVCYLSDLYVDPNIRGTGAGRALIDHVIAFARSRGLTNVRWLTHETNTQARRLYDTYRPPSGFILYSVPV
jgi:ribosomal protein S18 acetylase RimI-like enzyme